MTESNWRRYLVHEGPFVTGPKAEHPYDWRPVHRNAIAIILKCGGDGRHWVTTSAAPARALREVEDGQQVLGLVNESEVRAVLDALGKFPHQGDQVCERCLTKNR